MSCVNRFVVLPVDEPGLLLTAKKRTALPASETVTFCVTSPSVSVPLMFVPSTAA
jgi:hypothetical protein